MHDKGAAAAVAVAGMPNNLIWLRQESVKQGGWGTRAIPHKTIDTLTSVELS